MHVIAMFIITGAYVGYHAPSQQPTVEEFEEYNTKLEILNEGSESMQTHQKSEFSHAIIWFS